MTIKQILLLYNPGTVAPSLRRFLNSFSNCAMRHNICSKNDLNENIDDDCAKRAIIFIIVTCVIFVICQILYFNMAIREKISALKPRLKILSLRIAMIFPAYSLVSFFICIFPIAEPVIDFFGAIFEGLSFYSYAKLLLFNIGGYDAILSVMQEKTPTRSPELLPLELNMFLWFLMQFMVIRPILLVIAGIIEMAVPHEHLAYRAVYYLSVLSTVFGVVGLLRVHRKFSSKSEALMPERKIVSVKLFVLLIIIQNAIINLGHASRYNNSYYNVSPLPHNFNAFMPPQFGTSTPKAVVWLDSFSRSLSIFHRSPIPVQDYNCNSKDSDCSE